MLELITHVKPHSYGVYNIRVYFLLYVIYNQVITNCSGFISDTFDVIKSYYSIDKRRELRDDDGRSSRLNRS